MAPHGEGAGRERAPRAKTKGGAVPAPRAAVSTPFLQLPPAVRRGPSRFKADNEPQTGPSAGRAECRDRPSLFGLKATRRGLPALPCSFRCTTNPRLKSGGEILCAVFGSGITFSAAGRGRVRRARERSGSWIAAASLPAQRPDCPRPRQASADRGEGGKRRAPKRRRAKVANRKRAGVASASWPHLKMFQSRRRAPPTTPLAES
jgi:hypothetical protein